jgi:hypothetical protein
LPRAIEEELGSELHQRRGKTRDAEVAEVSETRPFLAKLQPKRRERDFEQANQNFLKEVGCLFKIPFPSFRLRHAVKGRYPLSDLCASAFFLCADEVSVLIG